MKYQQLDSVYKVAFFEYNEPMMMKRLETAKRTIEEACKRINDGRIAWSRICLKRTLPVAMSSLMLFMIVPTFSAMTNAQLPENAAPAQTEPSGTTSFMAEMPLTDSVDLTEFDSLSRYMNPSDLDADSFAAGQAPAPSAIPDPAATLPMAMPSPAPSQTAVPTPSVAPTPKPTAKPTPKPTAKPTPKPTAAAPKPTAAPRPASQPTPKPSTVQAAPAQGEWLTFSATFYNKAEPGMDGKGITATGTVATEGRTIAVDPKVIPYGTKVYIEGWGYRIAEDCGGAIKGNRIDIYIDSLSEALSSGRINVRLKIIG